jgi:glutaredoxin
MSASTPGVIVYSSTHCVYCKQVKQYLTEQNVPFEERKVDTNETFAEELMSMGMSAVPVTVIGDAKILGFNTARIQKALSELNA